MLIAVQSNLEYLISGLKEKGYNIINENSNDADIFIYDSKEYEGILNNSINSDLSNGIFMINAHNKSFSEIETMILQRSYSNLF